MKTNRSAASRSVRAARHAAVALLLGGAAIGALAQYKIVGPDGQVTYTDKPPTAADVKMPANGGAAPASTGGMPYETRQAMAKFPVTLYATKNCAPCDQARQALRQRGIPFNEYSVDTDADVRALQSRFNAPAAPVITIGGQTMSGYSPSNLSGYLDAAGYPAQAHLTGYSWPPAMPLTPPRPAPANVANAPVNPATPPSTPPPPSKSGIQF